jgi:hypothetical protein
LTTKIKNVSLMLLKTTLVLCTVPECIGKNILNLEMFNRKMSNTTQRLLICENLDLLIKIPQYKFYLADARVWFYLNTIVSTIYPKIVSTRAISIPPHM